MTTPLQDLLDAAVATGSVPGAAALVARGDELETGCSRDFRLRAAPDAGRVARDARRPAPLRADAARERASCALVGVGEADDDRPLTQAQRDASTLFLEGAGWGFGGAVGADGRYGWIGGTGTTAHVAASTGTTAILLTQVQMTDPTSTPLMREFWQYAF